LAHSKDEIQKIPKTTACQVTLALFGHKTLYLPAAFLATPAELATELAELAIELAELATRLDGALVHGASLLRWNREH